jgi:hypothetical protein
MNIHDFLSNLPQVFINLDKKLIYLIVPLQVDEHFDILIMLQIVLQMCDEQYIVF